jgi:hypothetical protein
MSARRPYRGSNIRPDWDAKLRGWAMLPENQIAHAERERQQREQHRQQAEAEALQIQRRRMAQIEERQRMIAVLDRAINPPQPEPQLKAEEDDPYKHFWWRPLVLQTPTDQRGDRRDPCRPQ